MVAETYNQWLKSLSKEQRRQIDRVIQKFDEQELGSAANIWVLSEVTEIGHHLRAIRC
jgi:hypothetical protein